MKKNKNLVYGLIVVAGILLAYITTQDEQPERFRQKAIVEKPQVTNRGESPVSLQPGYTQIGTIQAEIPNNWVKETPSSNMRIAQFRLPKIKGAEDGSIAVFAGIGGGIEGNINRWYGQFKRPDGKPVSEFASISKETVGHFNVTFVSAEGTYLASSMGGPSGEKPGYLLLAAIVETHSEPYFFKGTGPVLTMKDHEDHFKKFIRSILEL
ncbi:MAG: hypothetical protein ISR83_01685 [Candidatus Marinimicrobia bacterium]|nr:hypothetical protein [Candidatus Neomarinimicrobiota bacterium]